MYLTLWQVQYHGTRCAASLRDHPWCIGDAFVKFDVLTFNRFSLLCTPPHSYADIFVYWNI